MSCFVIGGVNVTRSILIIAIRRRDNATSEVSNIHIHINNNNNIQRIKTICNR